MGGKSSDTTSTVTQQNIPEEFYPYFDRLLTRAEESTLQPYVPYTGDRLAGTTADTQASYDMIRDIATRATPGADLASGVASTNVDRTGLLMNAAQPYQFSQYGGYSAGTATPYAGFRTTAVSPYSNFTAYRADPYADFAAADFSGYGGFTAGQATPYAGFEATTVDPYSGFVAYEADPYNQFREANFSEYDFGPTETLTAETTSQYMDPYIKSVLDLQKERAAKDYEMAQAGRNAAAVQAGAFGGSRQQVAESLAESDLLTRMREIDATGLQSAYADATRRFEADRAAKFATEQARAGEAARVQTGMAGEAGRVQGAQAGELARIQSLSANEFARLQSSQAAELARVQGISVEEASRIQQSRAAELARVQGISIEEAARIQAAQASEMARVQSGIASEAARVQAARAAETARIQNMDASEFARVQQSQAAELARVQGISVEEAARIQAAQAAELARVQGISIDEAARIQAAQAAELARVQSSQSAENQAYIDQQMALMGFSADQAGMVAKLEEAARTGDIQAAQLLEAIGKSQQSQTQAGLDLAYEDFLRQQGWNQQQLGYLSSILQGLPIGNTGTTTESQPYNPIQQALGAGLAGLSLYQGFTG